MDFLDGSETGLFILVILFAVGIGMGIKAFYLLTLQRAMEKVAVERREGTKGQIWLELIPIFSIVWQFFNVNRVTKSLENEFRAREMDYSDVTSAQNIGKAFCVLACCNFIPIVGGLAGLASFVCWIIFWVKISNIKNNMPRYSINDLDTSSTPL